jgi:hypothetical protein
MRARCDEYAPIIVHTGFGGFGGLGGLTEEPASPGDAFASSSAIDNAEGVDVEVMVAQVRCLIQKFNGDKHGAEFVRSGGRTAPNAKSRCNALCGSGHLPSNEKYLSTFEAAIFAQ